MNTTPQAKPKLKIQAKHIGPIMQLDHVLSDGKQNLIFARNGSGKSFIARAFRHMDGKANTSLTDSDLPNLLVSEEADTGKGHFKLFEGDTEIGGMELCTKSSAVTRSDPAYLFHIFSEDYVDDEIRNKLEELDGEITHEIIIGKENAELDALASTISSKQENQTKLRQKLDTDFDAAKGKLKSDFAVVGSLGAFKSLLPDDFFLPSPYLADTSLPGLQSLLDSFNVFKSLPSDPTTPKKVDFDFSFDENAAIEALATVTSMSSVEEAFKTLISENPAFFEFGLSKLETSKDHCPLCTQELKSVGLNAIAAYRAYFEDEEAKHKARIQNLIKSIETASTALSQLRLSGQKTKIDFDALKEYFPTMKDAELSDFSSDLEQIVDYFEQLRAALEAKRARLDKPVKCPTCEPTAVQNILSSLRTNNGLIDKLIALVDDSTNERRKLQSSACSAMLNDFAEDHSTDIRDIRKLAEDITNLKADHDIMAKNHGDKAPARERVADTFSKLLTRFFRDKYSFDKVSFKVNRNNKEMLRGGDRTLSDGEKSIMAFCYFLAQTHLRVETNDDYKKLYFVFDDPVTSMSFDYVYSIIMCLKLLRISQDGEIGFNLESTWHKPKMLILTHNNYFYNVASTNKIVDARGLYQLVAGSTTHQLRSQEAFATPHALQLQDVYAVSKGGTPDHTTPNSIRSVIESIGKFVQPDKKQFGDFVKLIMDDHGIEIKSTLIQDLCHGGKIDDAPHVEEDLTLAAAEAIEVVRKYAPGQLAKLDSA